MVYYIIMLFDFIKDILYEKKGDLLDNPDNHVEFQPYMLQRWMSMYSPDMAKIINLTTNRLYPIYNDKNEWYKALLTIIPKGKFKRIKYISKQKKEVKKDDDTKRIIKIIAQNKQISQREVENYIKEYNIDIKSLKLN